MAGKLLRKLRREAEGRRLELPPPHQPGDGVGVLARLLGEGMPTCITTGQVCRLDVSW